MFKTLMTTALLTACTYTMTPAHAADKHDAKTHDKTSHAETASAPLEAAASGDKTCAMQPLTATYHEVQTLPNGKKLERDLTLTRSENQVAIHYGDANITELWTQLKNKHLTLTRFFINHKRGISYEPSEIKRVIGPNTWMSKYQLLEPQAIESLTMQKTTEEGCARKEVRTDARDNHEVSVTWLPEQHLIEAYQTEHGGAQRNRITTLTLESVKRDPKAVRAYFDTLDNYQTTDYADVGDMESDPFLSKMINQGFIEHAASGFYNSDGQVIQGGGENHGHKH